MTRILHRLYRLALGLVLNVVYAFASLVPRDPKRWVFGAWNGIKFIDNPKHVFLHVVEQLPTVRATWITKDRNLATELQEIGLPAVHAASLGGIWAQLRAGVVVFTHSVEWDLWAPLIANRVMRVQTWHGMPIKRIGYDDDKGFSAARARLNTRLFPYMDDRVDLVTAAGSADQACYRSAFKVLPEAIVLTGYARNDALVRSMKGSTPDGRKQVVYMPTLRGPAGAEFTLFDATNFDFLTFDQECRRICIDLWVKLHPVQRFRSADLIALSNCEHIHAWTDAGDIYESIGRFDILVTDFSGIYFDFLISGRPIVMAPLDMAGYLEFDRNLYYEYEEICPDPPCMTWSEIFARLGELSIGEDKPTQRYLELQQRFHVHLDGKSAERVTASILQLIDASQTKSVDVIA